jgi:preprotein translocase subunit SecA
MVRADQNDQIFKTAGEKFNAILEDIRDCQQRGQPVLVGTTSIENSELLSGLLNKAGLRHEVLNAKQHAREAEIVAQAGKPGNITIATNMAGRGTDIVLGGSIEKIIETVRENEALSEADKSAQIESIRAQWQPVNEQVKAAGGLRIIGTERHESRRIDNQLRGRAGRQGDPGSSRFYLSLEDPLMRIFAGDRVRAIMDRLKLPEGEPIEAGMVSRSIETAQRKVEGRNFDVRKQLLEYDDVANDQRKVLYAQRNEVLEAKSVAETVDSLRTGTFTDLVATYVPEGSVEEQWDIEALQKVLEADWQLTVPLTDLLRDAKSISEEDILEQVLQAAQAAYQQKVEAVGAESWSGFERSIMLQVIDTQWREHLSALDHLRQGIHLRGYAQKNPKQEYKREAFELFSGMLDRVRDDVVRVLMTVRIQTQEEIEQAEAEAARAVQMQNVQYQHTNYEEAQSEETQSQRQAVAQEHPGTLRNAAPKVGRNDPCPCGSGKKYKHCHGQLT